VAPSEIGVYLDDRKEGERTRMELLEESQIKLKQMDNDKQTELKKMDVEKQKQIKRMPGRPSNITETTKRKKKVTEKPSTKAGFIDCLQWANIAQDTISEMVTKSLLVAVEKPNMRSLSKDEFDLVEKVKLSILCDFEPFEQVTSEKVCAKLSSNVQTGGEILGAIKTLNAQFVVKNNREPRVDELRQMYSIAYSLIHEKDNEFDENGV
jgi:hypothetical protein